ncbi:MAG: response regulator transcription factor [Humidesulfovibrio sp.]|jgi:two-component system phosphate regulon response regulator PhoB|uniref:response regulator transcription factor n=1 Tax=Humidesulfovibrio sp. TaxID=2910988 RepID=UPI0027348421|nr:response regulator transcription factor [Humidesulfovibrio sp.]MDP2847646.1 response regulator transcription factor [Humidesulfovibrio sp.]MDQ7835370.1 response regulator transcription factor [Humidesulfovibrio sp.]
MEQRRVMVVEDHAETCELLRYNLTAAGFEVRTALDGKQALNVMDRWRPDLVLLDLMLPEMDGFEVCRTLKQIPSLSAVPVIFLTARTDEVDRVVGLELGAEDYVLKPFSTRELLLRIKIVLRRTSSEHDENSDTFQREGLMVNFAAHEMLVDGEKRVLTATEQKLFKAIVQSRGRVLSRDRLLDMVWNTEFEGTSRTIDTHMRRLRVKLGHYADWIETLRGVGYRFKD